MEPSPSPSPSPNHRMLLRKILQAAADLDSIPEPSLSPPSNTSSSVRQPFNPNTPLALDSSMVLTILVLLTALFFLAFFSVYIRRLSASGAAVNHPSPPSSVNHKGGGLDGATVRSLPLVAYGKVAMNMIEDCPICLTEFSERESVKLIPYCGHVFHPNCIDTWLASHVTCPLCRSAQLFNPCLDVSVNVMDDKNLIGTSDISTVHGRHA